MAEPQEIAPQATKRFTWADAGWLAILFGVAGLVQLLTRVPFDGDTGYHLAVARMISRHGMLQSFPWTPFSWLAEHYADKELLFHLLLVPISGLDAPVASKIAGTLCGGILLATIYGVLRAEAVHRPGIWALCVLAASGGFIYRFALVRPHVVSIALAVLITWAAARRRYLPLLIAAFLYPLSYVAWHTAIVIAVVVEIGAVVARQRPNPRPLGAILAGLLAGILVHPNFPENLRFFWVQIYDVLWATAWGGKVGFDLGSEFRAMELGAFLRFALVPAVAAVLGVAWILRDRRAQPLAVGFGLLTAAFAILMLQSERFLEYFVPFAVMTGALTLGRLWQKAAVAVAGLGTAVTLAFGSAPVKVLSERIEAFAPETVEALRRQVPEGAQVFTCGWGETGEMMLALPERRFLVALDPVFFWRAYPDLYRLWFDLTHDPRKGSARSIREAFAADFVLCDSEWLPFLRALHDEPEAKLVLRSYRWFLFDLRGGSPPPRASESSLEGAPP